MSQKQIKTWINAASAGDTDSLQRLLIYYHERIRKVISVQIDPAFRSRLDPDDVLQVAYVAAFRTATKVQFDNARSFYRWLEALCIQTLKDGQQALHRAKRGGGVRRRMQSRDDPSTFATLLDRVADTGSSPTRQLERDDAMATVLASLARLPDDQRRVVRLRYIDGKTAQEVAEAMGKTEAAVHMLCHRGLRALRETLKSNMSFFTPV